MKHGGDLAEASRLYKVASEDWLDLSTGINPETYPFRQLPLSSWQKLPQSNLLDRLLTVARTAYRAPPKAPILAAPGTQILIELMPAIRPASNVAIVGPTYSEHAKCWSKSGANVEMIDRLHCPADAEIVIAGNPNNPDGRIWTPDTVRNAADEMAARGGLLIMDEAFADIAPEVSTARHAGQPGLLIMRSFGKFFGLAGLRLGFALGPEDLLARIDACLGLWAVSGPAIEVGLQAFDDTAWQQSARARCYDLSARLDDELAAAGLQLLGGTALFRLVSHPEAKAIHEHLASKGIWVRQFTDNPSWLRFGLPPDDFAFDQLSTALQSLQTG